MTPAPRLSTGRDRVARLALFALAAALAFLLGLQVVAARRQTQDSAAGREARATADLAARLVEAQARAALEAAFSEVTQRLQARPERAETLRQISANGPLLLVSLYQGAMRLFPPEDAARATPFEVARLLAHEGLLARLREPASGAPAMAVVGHALRLAACRALSASETLCVVLGEEAALAVLESALGAALPGEARVVAAEDETGALRFGTADAGSARVLAGAPLTGWTLRLDLPPAARAEVLPYALLAALLVVLALIARDHIRQARRAEEKAQRAEAAARLSHDLRTPLANLRLYAALMAAGHPRDAALQAQCAVMETETERLSALAESLLRAARGETSASPEAAAPGADALIERLIAGYAPLIEAARVHLRFEAAGTALVPRHAPAFERALVNLIDNLCRHAAGVSATLQARTEGAMLHLGLTHPVPEAGAGAGGFGMGLSILAALAQDAGGHFEDASDAVTMRFALHWPLRAREAA